MVNYCKPGWGVSAENWLGLKNGKRWVGKRMLKIFKRGEGKWLILVREGGVSAKVSFAIVYAPRLIKDFKLLCKVISKT